MSFSGVLSRSYFAADFIPPYSDTNLGGKPLPHQPDVSMNFTYNHAFHFANDATLTVHF